MAAIVHAGLTLAGSDDGLTECRSSSSLGGNMVQRAAEAGVESLGSSALEGRGGAEGGDEGVEKKV